MDAIRIFMSVYFTKLLFVTLTFFKYIGFNKFAVALPTNDGHGASTSQASDSTQEPDHMDSVHEMRDIGEHISSSKDLNSTTPETHKPGRLILNNLIYLAMDEYGGPLGICKILCAPDEDYCQQVEYNREMERLKAQTSTSSIPVVEECSEGEDPEPEDQQREEPQPDIVEPEGTELYEAADSPPSTTTIPSAPIVEQEEEGVSYGFVEKIKDAMWNAKNWLFGGDNESEETQEDKEANKKETDKKTEKTEQEGKQESLKKEPKKPETDQKDANKNEKAAEPSLLTRGTEFLKKKAMSFLGAASSKIFQLSNKVGLTEYLMPHLKSLFFKLFGMTDDGKPGEGTHAATAVDESCFKEKLENLNSFYLNNLVYNAEDPEAPKFYKGLPEMPDEERTIPYHEIVACASTTKYVVITSITSQIRTLGALLKSIIMP